MKTNTFSYGNMAYQNGILHVDYFQGVIIDENVLIQEIKCRKELTGTDDFFMLLDMSKAADITEGALALAAEHPCPENIKAIGVITRGGNDHTRAKLYSVFDKPNISTKAFLTLEEAKDWFRSLSDSNKAA